MANTIEIYSEFLKEKSIYRYYKIDFVERVLASGKSIQEFDLLSYSLFNNEYFLNKFLENEISKDELELLRNNFQKNTRLVYYENYFKDTSISKSLDGNIETTELTAYGQSSTQNRKIIAFRGKFKNGLLSSYESKIESCEPLSFQRNDKLHERFTLYGSDFLDEIIKSGVKGLLHTSLLNTLYANSIKGNFDVLDYFKKIINKKDIYSSPLVINSDPSNGVLLPGRAYYSDNVQYNLLLSSKSNENLENYYFSKFISSRMGVDNSVLSKTQIKGLKKKEYQIHKKGQFGAYTEDGYGFYINDVLRLLQDDFSKSFIFSENVKKNNPSLFELIDFSKEKLLKNQIDSLIQKSLNIAEQIVVSEKEAKKKEKKNTALGCIIIILVVLALVVFFS
jgi:hypothetical protein